MSIKPIEYNGKEYPSFSALCRAHGMSYNRVTQRLKAGWSLKDALTTAVTESGKGVAPVTDHLGNTYPSKKKMCEAYGINYRTYSGRIKKGMTMEEALTTPLNESTVKGKNITIDEDLHLLYLRIIGEVDDYYSN